MEGGHLVEQAVRALLTRGATTVVLACTETPLALDAVGSDLRRVCVGCTGALARSRVRWWQAHVGTQPDAIK